MKVRTVSEAVNLYLDWLEIHRKPGTVALYRTYLLRFVAHCVKVPLAKVRPVHAITFSSKFNALQAVRSLFAWLRSTAHLLKRNVMRGVKLPRVRQRVRVLAAAEQLRLLRSACRRYRDYLLSLRETVARPSEMRAVTWLDLRKADLSPFDPAALDDGNHFFCLADWKTKGRSKRNREAREIPVSPRLGRLLMRLWRKGPHLERAVFLNTKSAAWSANAVRCQMRGLRLRAGLLPSPAGEKVVNYTFRHTSATRLCRKGVNLHLLAEIMGHDQIKTTVKYLHPDRRDLSAVMKANGLKK